jgi:flagellar protein FliO/FliZ
MLRARAHARASASWRRGREGVHSNEGSRLTLKLAAGLPDTGLVVLHSRRLRLGGRLTLIACAALLLLLAPGEALADGFRDKTPLPNGVSDGAAEAATKDSGGSGGSFVRMIVGLLIVIAVIYGVYWLLKTYGKSKKADKGDGGMDVVATTALAQNRSLHLVRVGDELVLVGSAEQGVTPIRVYNAEEARRLGALLETSPDLRAVGVTGPTSGSERRGPTVSRMIEDLRRKTAR